jgi:hypothetical protein
MIMTMMILLILMAAALAVAIWAAPGKARVVRWNGQDVTLSLVQWGPFRRRRARRGKTTFLDTGARFIPRYEIAVFEGGARAGTLDTGKPEMVFYYPDKRAALLRFEDLRSAILEGGLDGSSLRDFIHDADLRRQHSWVLRSSQFDWGEE